MGAKKTAQATIQQMGGKGNLKRDPGCMANSKRSAGKQTGKSKGY